MKSKQLLNGSALNVVNLGVHTITAICLMPLMIKAFGDAQYGVWVLVAAFIGHATILDLGLPNAVNRFISQALGRNCESTDRSIQQITATAFYLFTVMALASIGVIGIIAIYFSNSIIGDPALAVMLRKLLLIMCIHNIVLFPSFVFEGALIAHLRFDLLNVQRIIFSIVRLFVIIIVINQNGSLIMVAWTIMACKVVERIAIVIMAYRVDRRISMSVKFVELNIIRKLFGYSLYALISRIADMLRFHVDALVITLFINVAAVTPYRIATRLIDFFVLFMSGINNVFNPYFSQMEGKNDYDAIRNNFLLITKINVFIASFIGILIISIGNAFITRWVGTNYSNSYYVLAILIVPYILGLMQCAAIPLLYGISKHHFIAWSNSIEGFSNLALSLLLVTKYGIFGVALGTAIPMIITKLIVQPIYISQIIGIRLKDYVYVIMAPLSKVVISYGVSWLLVFRILQPQYLSIVIVAIIQFVVFLATIASIGFTGTERKYFINLISRRVSLN